jgi:voltage-gated potassium channel Kch
VICARPAASPATPCPAEARVSPRVSAQSFIEKRTSRFLREPPKVRTAASVIVTATAIVIVAGGVLMWALDHEEYSNVWVGMWWAVQTVTTVGYGDVTPRNVSGRIIATFVMLEGIAGLTIIIAAITSTFVARAQRELRARDEGGESADGTQLRLDELDARLDRIESTLLQLTRE